MAKKVLKTKRNTAAAIPSESLTLLVVPANMAILADIPTAPKIIRDRRPNLSIVKIAIQDAIQYSVPFKAARRRLRKGDKPMLCSKIVAE